MQAGGCGSCSDTQTTATSGSAHLTRCGPAATQLASLLRNLTHPQQPPSIACHQACAQRDGQVRGAGRPGLDGCHGVGRGHHPQRVRRAARYLLQEVVSACSRPAGLCWRPGAPRAVLEEIGRGSPHAPNPNQHSCPDSEGPEPAASNRTCARFLNRVTSCSIRSQGAYLRPSLAASVCAGAGTAGLLPPVPESPTLSPPARPRMCEQNVNREKRIAAANLDLATCDSEQAGFIPTCSDRPVGYLWDLDTCADDPSPQLQQAGKLVGGVVPRASSLLLCCTKPHCLPLL